MPYICQSCGESQYIHGIEVSISQEQRRISVAPAMFINKCYTAVCDVHCIWFAPCLTVKLLQLSSCCPLRSFARLTTRAIYMIERGLITLCMYMRRIRIQYYLPNIIIIIILTKYYIRTDFGNEPHLYSFHEHDAMHASVNILTI